MPFKEEVPLCQRIEAFATPAIAGMMQNFPSTKDVPVGLLRRAVFTAILESGTHHPDDVSSAIAQLEVKYVLD